LTQEQETPAEEKQPVPAVVKATDLEELAQIIAAFDRSTAALQASHTALQNKVEELTGELSRKNEALSNSLKEVSALKNYLANILESITDGVLAVDLEQQVVALNHAAVEVIPALRGFKMGTRIDAALPAECAELGRYLIEALQKNERVTNVDVVLKAPEEKSATGRQTLSVSVSPIRNEQGALLGAVQTFRDLTELKELEERARRSERLAELGEMAAGVAHEIRNPLGGIELYASSLQRRAQAGSKEEEVSGKILAAATNLNRIVTDMLTFTRSRQLQLRPVAIERVCHMALDLAATVLQQKNIQVDLRYGTEKEPVQLDADQICQAFLNVILNATQAMPEGGTLTVSSRIEPHAGSRGGTLVVSFADTGPGIPDEIRDKLFNPFFTTRKEGTGLGLAIVHKIVQDHDGSLVVEPNQPNGAVFRFCFPLVASAAGRSNASGGKHV